ncbi:MAG: hypothetical protein WDN23_20065 [Edaphobacter sp.]
MKDGDAKEKLREFDEVIVLSDSEYWIRILPKITSRKIGKLFEHHWTGGAKLQQIGARENSTNPDGLYAYLKLRKDGREFEYCDIVAIEVCESLTNFYDKRSRYAGLGAGLILRTTPGLWRLAIRSLNGQKLAEIIQLNDNESRKSHSADDINNYYTPVRAIRAIYVLGKNQDKKLWENTVLAAHEFTLVDTDFAKWNTTRMTEFILESSHNRQFLSRRKKAIN